MRFFGVKKSRGFTMVEVIIVVAIIIILAAIAVPSYLGHLRAAEFSSATAAANGLKNPVAKCIQINKSPLGCNSAAHAIPAAVNPAPGIPGASVHNGVITTSASSDADYGVSGATYILSPQHTPNKPVTWRASGTACEKNYVNCN